MEPARWRSTTGLRTALVWLFAADALATIGVVVARLHRAGVIGDYKSFSATVTDLDHADDLVGSTSAIWFALFLATATVFIIWQWRSAKNNEMLGRIQPRYTPGWSIGGWFIPFANFVIPVRIVLDLWQGSDPETRNYRDWRGLVRWPVIAWWWGFYLLGNLVFRVSASGDNSLDQVRTADQAASVGMAFIAVAAVLAIVVVRTITSRQETARAQRPSTSAPVPGWYPDPTARFDHRYWDGTNWTDHVSKAGQPTTDPVAGTGGVG